MFNIIKNYLSFIRRIHIVVYRLFYLCEGIILFVCFQLFAYNQSYSSSLWI